MLNKRNAIKTIKYTLIGLLAILGLASCTPEQIAYFNTLTPHQQQTVVAHLQNQQRIWFINVAVAANNSDSGNCYTEMRKVFPSSTWNWATSIINRESRGNPTAKNPYSSASGCWQLLAMHDQRYYKVGCTPAQKFQARCNNLAAYDLYKAAGTSPWRVY